MATLNTQTTIPSKKTDNKWYPSSGKIQETPGKITKTIGSGNNAKYSIIYLVLVAAFISSILITILVVANHWCFRDCENKVPDITNDIKAIWDILTPIITMALGYAFGKSER